MQSKQLQQKQEQQQQQQQQQPCKLRNQEANPQML
jgi:hypothetical protein